jgi:hypothetical protein
MFALGQGTKDAGQTTNAVRDIGQQFGGGDRTKPVQ